MVLFDIRGHRRTVVRWVYGGLALMFLVGFVGFGVGSDVGGGLLGGGHGGSAGGHGGGGGSLEDQADELRERVQSDPADHDAWRRLSLVLANLAYEQSGGHGGSSELADDGRGRLVESVVAYEEYTMLLRGRRPARALAQTAARSYMTLRLPFDAVKAQRLAARRRDPQGQFLLAQYEAASGDSIGAERALRRAIAAAPAAQRQQLRGQRAALQQLVTPPSVADGHGG